MPSQVPDIVGHHGGNPERGALLGAHRPAERRDPDQERRPLQPLALGGPRPDFGRFEVELQGQLRRQVGRDQGVASNRLDQLSRQARLAPRDPALLIDGVGQLAEAGGRKHVRHGQQAHLGREHPGRDDQIRARR